MAPVGLVSSVKTWCVLLVLAAALAAVSGCASSQDPALLLGKTWECQQYRPEGGELTEPLSPPPTAEFSKTRISGFSGVNTYGGTYSTDGDSISFGPINATLMAGEPQAMQMEVDYLAALGAASRYRVTESSLELFDDRGSVLARFSPARKLSLEGTDWECLSYNNGKEAVVSVLASAPISAKFADGTLSGVSGVNSYSTSYTLYATKITIDPEIATTLMAGPDDAMEQERLYLAALPTATRVQVKQDTLTLLTADGARVAEYRASK